MTGRTLLRRLLEAARTLDGTVDASGYEGLPDYIRSRDFYGSPLNNIEAAVPYPHLPLRPDPLWQADAMDEPARYPPHTAMELQGNTDIEIDVVSTWPIPPLPDEGGLPVRAVIFLEALRCIAAPKTDTNVEYLAEGILAPKKLMQGYFTQVIQGYNGPLVLRNNEPTGQNMDDPGLRGELLQRRLFRETFLAVYTHVLLRHLAVRQRSFVTSIVNTLDDRKRGNLFKQALSLPQDSPWTAAINSAYHCIRRPTFRQLFLGPDGHHGPATYLIGLDGLSELPLGKPGAYFLEPHERTIRLPKTLAALMHLCIERAGPKGSLFADNAGWMRTILEDAERFERIDDLLSPEHWLEFEFPAGDKQHDGGPGVHLATWSCLCAVFEALSAGVLSTNPDAPGDAPSPQQ